MNAVNTVNGKTIVNFINLILRNAGYNEDSLNFDVKKRE
jgi:hypothetical protein